MRPLFTSWSEVAPRLAAPGNVALFLDFDGTLAPMRPRPDLVRVHPATRRALATLARHPRFRVCVISARRRADILAHLRVPAVRYLGLYGWERTSAIPAPSPSILHVRQLLRETLPVHPSLWIEDKQHTIAVHYRGAPDDVAHDAAGCVNRAVEPWRSVVRIAPGKCVWEIVPRAYADKGAAVLRELALLPTRPLPVYVGDDLSDESAFAAVPNGLAIRVGSRRNTRARYRLDGADEVRRFLERLRTEFL